MRVGRDVHSQGPGDRAGRDTSGDQGKTGNPEGRHGHGQDRKGPSAEAASMSSSNVLQIEPWEEIVGTVQGVGEVYVVIEASKKFKISREAFSPDQIEKLHGGVEVGILFRDDGPTLIREISPVPRDHSVVVRAPTHAQNES